MGVSKYESDQREPDVTKLIKLAELGNVDMGWLLMGGGLVPEEGAGFVSEAGERYYYLDKEGFVFVPKYAVEASAGHGEVIHSEQIVDYLAFKREWVKRDLGIDPSHLVLITAVGDSMEPTIRAGDLLLLDRGVEKIKDDSLYAIAFDGTLLIKRIQRLIDGQLIIKSDNPKYQEQTLSRQQSETLIIVGRLVWIGRRF
jgi:phage repressor protein C with HTH and peptisase S24 domain